MDEKKKRNFGKSALPAFCALLVIIAAAAGSVFAFLADADSAVNDITFGAVKTEIIEEFPENQQPVPGGGIEKRVSIENIGPNDCYVRVQILFSDSEIEELCTVNSPDPDNWSYEDGWWYYKRILKSLDTTSPVMDGLTISAEAGQEDLHGFDIYVRQESIQSEGHADAKSAFSSLTERGSL